MSRHVGTALLRAVESHSVTPEYDTLPERYRRTAEQCIDQYAADAGFNGLDYERSEEREQVDIYAEAIRAPGEDQRLPAWCETDLNPDAVIGTSSEDIAGVRDQQ